jgi:iron-sulfur cluster insertion protein
MRDDSLKAKAPWEAMPFECEGRCSEITAEVQQRWRFWRPVAFCGWGPAFGYAGACGPTSSTAARIAGIVAETKQASETALRVAVLAGGCSGFQYRFELDPQTQPDDLTIERGPARVVVDAVNLDLLTGSELDYTDELMGSHFAVSNPNAKSACGCGTSFAIDWKPGD